MTTDAFRQFLATVHPYDAFPPDMRSAVASDFRLQAVKAGQTIYTHGTPLDGLYLIETGRVSITDANGAQVSTLGPANSFGERGLVADGLAATTATADTDARLWLLPAETFHDLLDANRAFARFFARGARKGASSQTLDLATLAVATFMSKDPVTCTPRTTAAEAAERMRQARISSLCVLDDDGHLAGIVTLRDLVGRVLAAGQPGDTPVAAAMTPDPITLPPSALGSDVLNTMMECGIGHIPIAEGDRLLGIVTQTDLIRRQALSAAFLVGDVAEADDAAAIASATARIPELLVQLVGAGKRHDVVTRLVTDIADAATRRLLDLAEASLGPPPVPYLWLACGSQGRREQTGVTDQDNCLFIDDAATDADMAYFEALARFVCDGLNTAGYIYCPGDMMASNPRWRQRVSVWRSYFRDWIATPNPEAQMLASVMFDLRPIGGPARHLFDALQAETLAAASRNSIFVAHMAANSLKHRPPLGLLGGLSMPRSGTYRNTIDMKANGVVPVTDLGRLYALGAELRPVNTRERLVAAAQGGAVSKSGGGDLLDAYDVIARTRLAHQARRAAAGEPIDNHLPPAELSSFERSHLRDAFVVVRTMQSAAGQGRGTVL